MENIITNKKKLKAEAALVRIAELLIQFVAK